MFRSILRHGRNNSHVEFDTKTSFCGYSGSQVCPVQEGGTCASEKYAKTFNPSVLINYELSLTCLINVVFPMLMLCCGAVPDGQRSKGIL